LSTLQLDALVIVSQQLSGSCCQLGRGGASEHLQTRSVEPRLCRGNLEQIGKSELSVHLLPGFVSLVSFVFVYFVTSLGKDEQKRSIFLSIFLSVFQ
jgi:hypothetical protein